MKNKVRILKFLTWYKSLKEEQLKLNVFQARTNLEKLLKDKEMLLNQKKNNYISLKDKKEILAEDLKNYYSQIEQIFKYQQILDYKIKKQKEELKNLYRLWEKIYKEKKLMEILRDKNIKKLIFENTKKFYKEMDELTILKISKNEDI